MRVVHLVPSRAWGGAEQVAQTLHARSLAHGLTSTLDLPFTPGDPRVAPWRSWSLRPRAFDVMHAHLPWPDRLGPALVAARARPLVVTFHLLPEAGRWPRDRITKLPSEWMLRLAARRPRVRWVALSRADQAVLSALLGDRVSVIRNAPPAPGGPARPIDWPAGALRLLSVGRLSWQKGFDAMLRTLAHPALRALPWHWNLLGDGEDRASLDALRRSLGLEDRVTLVGARPALDGLAGADLLLAPSRREGMPLVPLEAVEAGVAVLASPIAPHRELFEDAPGSLLPEDPAAWPDALARVLTDPSLRAAMAASQRALVGASARDTMFSAYEALYNSA